MDSFFHSFPLIFSLFISPQLLLIQAFRPDRLQSAMAAFATQVLGKCLILALFIQLMFPKQLSAGCFVIPAVMHHCQYLISVLYSAHVLVIIQSISMNFISHWLSSASKCRRSNVSSLDAFQGYDNDRSTVDCEIYYAKLSRLPANWHQDVQSHWNITYYMLQSLTNQLQRTGLSTRSYLQLTGQTTGSNCGVYQTQEVSLGFINLFIHAELAITMFQNLHLFCNIYIYGSVVHSFFELVKIQRR